jgi:hypothetical protein
LFQFSFLKLSEGWFVKGAQFATVQAISRFPKQFACLDADLQMGGDSFFVETVGLPR